MLCSQILLKNVPLFPRRKIGLNWIFDEEVPIVATPSPDLILETHGFKDLFLDVKDGEISEIHQFLCHLFLDTHEMSSFYC